MEFGKEYIKTFDTEAEYLAFKASSGYNEPNVSYISGDDIVHYNPWVETRVVAKYNVTDTSNPTKILNASTGFSSIEIDGVEQPSVITGYTFNTTGEHTVKYTLTDPTSIGTNTFAGCSGLTSVTIGSGVTTIADGAFQNCSSLTSCTIGSGVTSIGYNAFAGCSSLTSIDIPSGVTTIGASAFRVCSNLTSIVIPSGVTSIGLLAFNSCSGLTSITIEATTPPTLGMMAFDGNASGRKIYVPSASVNAYKTNWSDYASDIEPIS